MPYRSLLARVQRFAFREFSRDPELSMAEFEKRLGKHIFGDKATTQATEDLLEVQRIYTFESDWYWSSPLIDPEFFAPRSKRLNWPKEKLAAYAENLKRLRAIAERHRDGEHAAERELSSLAKRVVDAWGERSPLQIVPE